jgi:hypothetical protein
MSALNTKNHQHLWSQFETRQQRARVVFLGASNLSRSFPSAVGVAQQAFARPLSIHAAMGFGRSYGKESGLLGKKFSGIFLSRIWEALDTNSAQPTIAFVTDIGNDLAYEHPVDAILEWVDGCISRLIERGAVVALTNIPIDILRTVGETKFLLLRSVLFPRCRLRWSVLLDSAEQLSDRLTKLAETRKRPIFSVPNEWYGFDPIHPRASYMRSYWAELFALATGESRTTTSERQSLRTYWRLRTMSSPRLSSKAPAGRFLPSKALLDDGTTITLY